jgi:hypothetical protein
MTNAPSNTASNSGATAAMPQSQTAADTKQIVLKDIGTKWDKFSEQDLSALKGKDDLVTQVVAKYGIEKAQAQSEVDTVLKGRQL